jgi:hypothetical protein
MRCVDVDVDTLDIAALLAAAVGLGVVDRSVTAPCTRCLDMSVTMRSMT